MALLAAVIFFVIKAPSASHNSKHTVNASSISDAATGPLDQVSSADIAVHVAFITGLPEATSVANHADSVSAVEATAPIDTSVAVKPQVLATALPSAKDIHVYTVVAGDTISDIANKAGVSSDSVRWSNGLTGNSVPAGKQLVLPPSGVNGIVYTVKLGETVDMLAQKYSADKDLMISFNDAEVSGIKSGQQILIPGGVIQAPAAVSAPSSGYRGGSAGFAWGGSTAIYSSNGYDYGWCTWWAAKRRGDIGNPIPSNLGNANSWRYLAERAGLSVNGSPSAGAVAYYKQIGGLGHVGFVEQVNDDGSIWISDMNYQGVSEIGGSAPAGGWGRTSYHLVTPDGFGAFLFIH